MLPAKPATRGGPPTRKEMALARVFHHFWHAKARGELRGLQVSERAVWRVRSLGVVPRRLRIIG
jgi:hypothetical protein